MAAVLCCSHQRELLINFWAKLGQLLVPLAGGAVPSPCHAAETRTFPGNERRGAVAGSDAHTVSVSAGRGTVLRKQGELCLNQHPQVWRCPHVSHHSKCRVEINLPRPEQAEYGDYPRDRLDPSHSKEQVSLSSLLQWELLRVESHMTVSSDLCMKIKCTNDSKAWSLWYFWQLYLVLSEEWPCYYKAHRVDIKTSLNAKVGCRFTAQLKLITLLLTSLE